MINQGRLQAIINAKKLLEDEGYQSPRLNPTQNQIDGENSRFMELVDTIATHITEMNFGQETFELAKDGMIASESDFVFTEEAQDYYSGVYEEYETLINNYLKN
tara:strand:- start:148 stop:459 length:312 start_codon:yes stop_codon:yes gene_type:complete